MVISVHVWALQCVWDCLLKPLHIFWWNWLSVEHAPRYLEGERKICSLWSWKIAVKKKKKKSDLYMRSHNSSIICFWYRCLHRGDRNVKKKKTPWQVKWKSAWLETTKAKIVAASNYSTNKLNRYVINSHIQDLKFMVTLKIIEHILPIK